ncbi:MAG TPA: hypothetical protein VN700_06310 [Vicinamibacterales bacterium]|nr:hypothetical protein [Vicinamibacterales bacterium]
MTQDLVVTLVATGTAALLVARWWRRRKRAEPACANCESSGAKKDTRREPTTGAPNAEVKPVAFFGSSKRRG